MGRLIDHGEGGGIDGRPVSTRLNASDSFDNESDQDLLCIPFRGFGNSQRRGMNVMSLRTEHRTHIHHIFYELCKERGWALGLPTSFDWEYLPDNFTKVQARIILTDGKPVILFHPAAFNKDNGKLVKGLLHHEMCHFILGPDVGHGPVFHDYEQIWDGYYHFKQESADFARWLARQNPQFNLHCYSCGHSFMRDTVPKGRMACRSCCNKHANGQYDDNYALHIGGAVMDNT